MQKEDQGKTSEKRDLVNSTRCKRPRDRDRDLRSLTSGMAHMLQEKHDSQHSQSVPNFCYKERFLTIHENKKTKIIIFKENYQSRKNYNFQS